MFILHGVHAKTRKNRKTRNVVHGRDRRAFGFVNDAVFAIFAFSREPKRWIACVLVAMPLACGAEPEQVAIEPPQVLTDSIPFVYPIELWDHNISGQTIVLVRVNPLGQVDSVAIDAGSGYSEFDSAAVQGAHKLRFIAARQGDRRIPMWTKVPVRFSRDTTTKMGIGGQ